MYASPTLTLYLGRQFLTGIVFVLFLLLTLVFFIDLVEHLRRASGHDQVGLGLILHMTVLNLPGLAQKLLPFAALFGAMLTFSRLTRSHELIVARAAGVSAWQFLAPGIAIAALAGRSDDSTLRAT
jgi:lipopolysaccharide export system permease protein